MLKCFFGLSKSSFASRSPRASLLRGFNANGNAAAIFEFDFTCAWLIIWRTFGTFLTPMNLFILRHGIAADPGDPAYPNDSERPLTDEGERKLARISEAMARMELSFDLVLSSPYVRARQTAEIVAEALGLRKKLQFSDDLKLG